MSAPLLLRSVRVHGRVDDVLIEDGRIAATGCGPGVVSIAGLVEIDGRGGLLLPGLHDHHVHLLAAAAADESVVCGPPGVVTRDALADALAAAPGTGWIRGIGYDESVAGSLDRGALDAMTSRPVRIQHRGGSLWCLNSAALEELGLATSHPDGRLWREDELLRARRASAVPNLAALGARLARLGVTGVTDATPGDASALASVVHGMPQHVMTMGTDPSGRLVHGPCKIVVGDHALPGLDDVVARIAGAHDIGRAAAVHSVTRESLLLVLAAFELAGVVDGDRVEHAAVVPPESLGLLVRLGLTVVTQPSLVALRGAGYLDEVDADDVRHLWPYASLRAAGVRVGCSSDAPHGDLDPWAGIRAARDRRTSDGRVVGADERVPPRMALAAYLSDSRDPGGPPRGIEPGAPADLVLLDVDEDGIEADPDAGHVRLTVIAGRVVHRRDRA